MNEVNETRAPLWSLLALVGGMALLTLLFGIAGESDYQEALLAEQNYCNMVAAGDWPDYKGEYANWCGEK